jgi:hypothetical protein
MFERWRMEAREKRKEREESRGVEREVNELNERMEALQKQFVKEKEQWKVGGVYESERKREIESGDGTRESRRGDETEI